MGFQQFEVFGIENMTKDNFVTAHNSLSVDKFLNNYQKPMISHNHDASHAKRFTKTSLTSLFLEKFGKGVEGRDSQNFFTLPAELNNVVRTLLS